MSQEMIFKKYKINGMSHLAFIILGTFVYIINTDISNNND